MSVYFVTCRAANAVKIGYSGDARIRIKEIQVGCPMPVELEALLAGRFAEEAALHSRFAEQRLCGEWFTLTEEIEEIIAAHPAPPPRKKEFPQYYRHPRHSNTLAGRVRAQLRFTQIQMADLLDLDVSDFRRYEYGYGRWKAPPPELEQKLLSLVASAA